MHEQSQLYKKHKATCDKARQVIQYHKNIQAFKTIPKQYLPSKNLQIVQPTTTLIREFQTKYEELFFDHLNHVITSNTITLELEEAKLRQIVLYTEKQLAESKEPSSVIADLHHLFITNNSIIGRTTYPALLQHITGVSTPPSTSMKASIPPQKPSKKRKHRRYTAHSNPKKRQKQDPQMTLGAPPTPSQNQQSFLDSGLNTKTQK